MATSDIYLPLAQSDTDLAHAADGLPAESDTACPARTPPDDLGRAVGQAIGDGNKVEPPAWLCQQTLKLTFFFDGTGNNIDADSGTDQQSNVARLYNARVDDTPHANIYSFYCYGIGTYFREIGDPGGEVRSLAFGKRGHDRLDWAFKKFDERIHAAEMRAQNPTNKIVSIRIAVFGFSRGAALARAFVRDLQARRCTLRNGRYVLTRGGYPVEVTFLGLFDTVASFGLPMSSNTMPISSTAGLISTRTTVNLRAMSPTAGIRSLPFGEPGADPAPGDAHGHKGPAEDLRIPAIVQRCVHLVAAHEYRNSFPLESCMQDSQYLGGVLEMVYPGTHSDVGGGYQPGEGGRSPHQAELLSMVTLRIMHDEAMKCGVPLYALDILPPQVLASFAMDEDGKARFGDLLACWTHYMKETAAQGNLGEQCLAHMKQYYRWRFHDMARRRKAQKEGGHTPGDQAIRRNEAGFAQERACLKREVAARQAELTRARAQLDRAEQDEFAAWREQWEKGIPIDPDLTVVAQEARERVAEADDAYLTAKAALDTYADDGQLLASMAVYDQRLLDDVQTILQELRRNPRLVLRPHYRNLVEAYQDEFVRGNGLKDEKIIAFFDRYVHDSLSGFARDATLPSDPRVLYVGGNSKMQYARTDARIDRQTA